MKFKKSFNKCLLVSKMMIEDYVFKCANRISPSYFTRSGKMGFKETILFMLNMINKSVQVELNNFFQSVLKKDCSISKQALSENRQKIDPKAFIELNRINQVVYEECDEYELWNGYRVSAIDGTTVELPNTELLRNEFGYAKNQYVEVAVARGTASCIFDVLNKIIIKSKIDRYKISERKMAMDLILEMKQNNNLFKDLILFDRGYPSQELIAKLIDMNICFVMRLKTNTFKKKIDSTKQD